MSGYRTIVADPPWPMRWSGGAASRRNGRGEIHVNRRTSVRALEYPTMSLDAIRELRIGELCDPEGAHLYLWTPDVFLLSGDALSVVEAWGFERPRLLIWRKSGFGLGTFPRPQHEAAIVAVRGKLPFEVRDIGSVVDFPLVYGAGYRLHSAKPDGFLDLVERVSPEPRLELFARRNRLGWDTWGNEALEHVEIGPPA